MKKIILFILAILPMMAYAQEETEFWADRPGATTGTDVIAKKALMWETGMEFESDRTASSTIKTWNINNSLLRYGLTDFAELRFGFAYNCTYTDTEDFGGFSDLTLGTKVKIFEGYKCLPAVSLLGSLLIPGGENHNYLPERIGGDFHLLFNHEFCSWCSLGYDVGLAWPGSTGAREETFLGFSLSFAPTDKFGFFIEEYNTFADETTCKSEVGVSYMVHPRVQIDAYTDLDWKHLDKYNTVGIGVAWRIL